MSIIKMKRVFCCLTSAAVMISSAAMVPVYAEDDEEIPAFILDEEPAENEHPGSEEKEESVYYEYDETDLTPLLAGPDGEASVIRIADNDRYGTAAMVCSAMYSLTQTFENVIVADGKNYPDALSGGYLAKTKGASILLTDASVEPDILGLIRENIAENGNVYILGGTSAVSSSFENGLSGQNINVRRFAGSNRYETNLEILKECYQEGDELLVASGNDYPDSVSGSAAEKPMMLVGSELTKEQKDWIKETGIEKIYILGGIYVVSPEIETELGELASVERVAGMNRWKTSLAIARKFNPDAEVITVATGLRFPDALSGSPLAMALGSPILLVADDCWQEANEFVNEYNIANMLVIGGRSAVSAITVDRILYGIYNYPTFKSLGINSSLDSAINNELDILSGIMLEGEAPTRITGLSDYDKALGVLNYVGANYEYGSEYTAEGMLRTGAGTCFAYSELIYFMLKKLGVTCWQTVPGRHRDGMIGGTYRQYGSQHRSVIALIDGTYYDVDGNFAYLYVNQMNMVTEPAAVDEAYAKFLIGMTDSY